MNGLRGWRMPRATAGVTEGALDVAGIREHFEFPRHGRIVTNNAASTQPPRELVDLYRALTPWYENVHRGQSTASQRTTALFEDSLETIATWLNAPDKRCIVPVRNHRGHQRGDVFAAVRIS